MITVHDLQNRDNEVTYAVGELMSILGLRSAVQVAGSTSSTNPVGEIPVLSYVVSEALLQAPQEIRVYRSEFFGDKYLTHASLPKRPLEFFRFQDERVPIIYAGNGPLKGQVILRSENGLPLVSIEREGERTAIYSNIDIIASSFFMLTRYEEVISEASDRFGRFPASASLAYQEGFLTTPVVNAYSELLWGWIKELAPQVERRPRWPEGKGFAVTLSHDVDQLLLAKKLWAKAVARRYLRRSDASLVSRAAGLLFGAWDIALNRNPYWTYPYLLDLESRLGLGSTFYFLAVQNQSYDESSYSLEDPRAIKLIHELEKRGVEIGLHGSFESYNRPELLAEEKSRMDAVLREPCRGIRQHYLRWRAPQTWRIQEGLGFEYDATLGYADHEGFRSGICLPFQPFDIEQGRKLNIWELPLTVMDRSLMNLDYRGFSPEQGLDAIEKLLLATRKYGGVFSLLWHPHLLGQAAQCSVPQWRGVFEQAAESLAKHGAFSRGCREVVRWWREHADV